VTGSLLAWVRLFNDRLHLFIFRFDHSRARCWESLTLADRILIEVIWVLRWLCDVFYFILQFLTTTKFTVRLASWRVEIIFRIFLTDLFVNLGLGRIFIDQLFRLLTH
jgi:hypothetical protein